MGVSVNGNISEHYDMTMCIWRGERVKEWWMMRMGMMRKMGWQADEELNKKTRLAKLTKGIWKLTPKTM